MGARKPTVSEPMAAPRHVAIVGCGFTGTSALHQLVESYPVRAVTIFEKTGDFGPGYPYRTWEAPDYLINNTADTMGIVPEDRRAFLRWLEGRPDLAPNPEPTGHYPRAFFGWFLKDAFEAAARGAETKGIALHLVSQEAVDIEETAEGVLLHGAEGETHAADVAILTTGLCPDRDAYGPPKDGMTCHYYPSHIPGAVLDDVPLDATCHVHRLGGPPGGQRGPGPGHRALARAGPVAALRQGGPGDERPRHRHGELPTRRLDEDLRRQPVPLGPGLLRLLGLHDGHHRRPPVRADVRGGAGAGLARLFAEAGSVAGKHSTRRRSSSRLTSPPD